MIIRHLLIQILFIFIPKIGYCQGYASFLIPDSLIDNSNAIIRNYEETLELSTINSGVIKTKEIITILNAKGERNAILQLNYDKNSKVSGIKACIYNKQGSLVRKIKNSEIIDSPAYSEVTLFSDNRTLYFKPSYSDYPYTVEYEYVISYKNMISYTTFIPVFQYNISCEKAQLKVIHPHEINYKIKELNIAPHKLSYDKEKRIETWSFKSFNAINQEPYDINIQERVPCVYLMPTEIIYDKYIGSANNWNEFGKWIYKLYEGKDFLTEKEKVILNEKVKNSNDQKEKIKILYNYLQSHTRYVCIQLGIGGYQPFSAETVFENGYGDCKALSNYMYAILKSVGIVSFPALVSAGNKIEKIFQDFPNFNQFNHVILCVPMKTDTIWLECTDQESPFRFLGKFTDNREVLLITKDGGVFAHTKRYSAENNLQSSITEIILDNNGSAKGKSRSNYYGVQYSIISDFLNDNIVEQKKWFYDKNSFPSFTLIDYNITKNKTEIPSAKITTTFTSRNYCSSASNYLIIPLNKVNKTIPINKLSEGRKSDILLQRSYIDNDTIIFEIPSDFEIESKPKGASIKSEYGEYTFSVDIVDNKIIYTRHQLINEGLYKACEYQKLYDYLFELSKNDNTSIMIKKK